MSSRRPIRRILVALDASPHSLAALAAATELAALLKAELAGLFVEDVSLLRLAQYPFTREYGIFTGNPRAFTSEQVEQQLRAQASRARSALAMLAEQAQVRWSFRVVRGSVIAEVLTAAGQADMITLGRIGWSFSAQRPLGSTTRAVLARAPGLAMVLEHGIRLGLAVMCIFDGTPAAYRAMAAATDLARARSAQLVVLIPPAEDGLREDLQAEASQHLQVEGIIARYRHLPSLDALRLLRVLQTEGCGLLVVPGEAPVVQDEGLFRQLRQMGCPILVVRARGDDQPEEPAPD